MPLPKTREQARAYYPYAVVAPVTRPKSKIVKKKKTKRANPIARFILLTLLSLFAYFIMPTVFEKLSKPLFIGGSYPEIKIDTYNLLHPTVNYISNDLFLNRRFLNGVPAKLGKNAMTTLYLSGRMTGLESKLRNLMASYPTIKPAIFVWDFNTGRYVDINSDKIYPAASIIKIPVLVQLFKSIEADQFSIYDTMPLTDYYKASGSGNLQYAQDGQELTLDALAKTMIQDSDNTATNMLMSAVGSMTDVNSALRRWGIKNTYVKTWLPDLTGTNYTTAKDMATILYNLDNPGFLNINSREYIIDYMSHVKNNRLIQAGLEKNALFVHKTGDIGKMLGDAGIVYPMNDKKYIVVILAKRPHNAYQGKEFIQKASELIYNSVVYNK